MTEALAWVGADPDGRRNFGHAIWREGTLPVTWCVDCAHDALQAVAEHRDGRAPAGVGVNAPLWWSGGISSDREADRWIRRTYKLSGGAVQAANSLQGAALVQAAMFIDRFRASVIGTVRTTEVHPKALLRILTGGDWSAFARRYGIHDAVANEHERDALIGAIAALEGSSGRWGHDLGLIRLPEEQNPRSHWLAPVHYYWPDV